MTTSTGGSTGSFDLSDINTDIDGYNLEGDELHHRLLETEPEQENNNETNI